MTIATQIDAPAPYSLYAPELATVAEKAFRKNAATIADKELTDKFLFLCRRVASKFYPFSVHNFIEMNSDREEWQIPMEKIKELFNLWVDELEKNRLLIRQKAVLYSYELFQTNGQILSTEN